MVSTAQPTTFAILETEPLHPHPFGQAKAMKTRRYKQGVTLAEMLIVVGVIALLASMVIGIVARIESQSKERGLKSTFELLEGALQEYHEYTNAFPGQPETNLANAAAHSEYLHKELGLIPNSQKVLSQIDDSFIRNNYGTVDTPPEVYDPWGTVLDYMYVPGDNFPELISAGPDKIFGTADDISNR